MLAACCDMFSPMNDIIGEGMGLWKPICKHPIVLALAIKKLIATSVFTPSPSELREAMAKVKSRIDVHAAWLGDFLSWVGKADRLLFEFDRPAWEAAYAGVHSNVAAAMAGWLNQGPGADESRVQALKAIWKEKRKAEQAMLAPPEAKRIAPSTSEVKPTRLRHKCAQSPRAETRRNSCAQAETNVTQNAGPIER
jgi:hypothetical protein